MNTHRQLFIQFMESIRTPDNVLVVDAILEGYQAIEESVFDRLFSRSDPDSRKAELRTLSDLSIHEIIHDAKNSIAMGKNIQYCQDEISMCEEELEFRELTGGRPTWTGANGNVTWMGSDGKLKSMDKIGAVTSMS